MSGEACILQVSPSTLGRDVRKMVAEQLPPKRGAPPNLAGARYSESDCDPVLHLHSNGSTYRLALRRQHASHWGRVCIGRDHTDSRCFQYVSICIISLQAWKVWPLGATSTTASKEWHFQATFKAWLLARNSIRALNQWAGWANLKTWLLVRNLKSAQNGRHCHTTYKSWLLAGALIRALKG